MLGHIEFDLQPKFIFFPLFWESFSFLASFQIHWGLVGRLDERKRRKDFILERNLFYPDAFEKNISPEEKEIYQRYKVFMRFHTKEEHEELMKTVIEDHQIMKRIQDLQV